MAKEINKPKVVAYLGDSKLELSTPLNVNGKEINVINLREPKVKDLKAVSHIHNELEQTSTLIANIGGFTLEELEEFPIHIYIKLQGLVEPFLR